jgi:hypothetical protein
MSILHRSRQIDGGLVPAKMAMTRVSIRRTYLRVEPAGACLDAVGETRHARQSYVNMTSGSRFRGKAYRGGGICGVEDNGQNNYGAGQGKNWYAHRIAYFHLPAARQLAHVTSTGYLVRPIVLLEYETFAASALCIPRVLYLPY